VTGEPALAVQVRRYLQYHGETPTMVEAPVIAEARWAIYLGPRELVTLMCSPTQLEALVYGFLKLEGIIASLDEVASLRLCHTDGIAEVWLASGRIDVPRRRVLTSGCGGGTSFTLAPEAAAALDRLRLPPPSGPITTPAALRALHRALQERATLYQAARGVHAAALGERDGAVLLVAQDIGRHNTLDKLCGEALLAGIDPAGLLLATSGRISSEMLIKAASMGVPLIASRTSPTAFALALAERLNITVCGYVRAGQFNVYTCPERIGA